MIKRTFLDKSNTIFEGNDVNYGLHPISMLNYGLEKSRILLHFNIEEIKEFIENCPENSKITHTLKMTNCGSIDFKHFDEKILSRDVNGTKKRATSFYIYAFPIPNHADSNKTSGYIDWDEGIGFDCDGDFWLSGASSVSNEGSNWFNRKSGLKWKKNGCIDVGGYIIGEQHFDHGNENLEIDITSYINNILYGVLNETNGEWASHNDGICLSIEPFMDATETEALETNYVGFFNENTNTFFAPYVESRCEEAIQDDRYNFIKGRNNKLYLYVSTPEGFVDLDETPICTIEGISFEVKRFSQGIYYIEVNNEISLSSDVIYEDVWGIKLNGVYDEITQEFVPHSNKTYFSITPDAPKEEICEPSLSGINDDEHLNSDEIRKIDVKFRVPYSTKYKTLNNTEYRLYTKDGNKQIDVISWDKIHNAGNINFFMLNTSELVSGKYYVDIRIKTVYQTRVFENVLHFNKVDNITRITR